MALWGYILLGALLIIASGARAVAGAAIGWAADRL
jgi:hypothetical protein